MRKSQTIWNSGSKTLPLIFALILFLLTLPRPAFADSVGLILRGVVRTLVSVVELPKGMITGGVQSFPLGIVTGTVTGAVRMIGGTLVGAADIARGAAPYAKYAAIAAI